MKRGDETNEDLRGCIGGIEKGPENEKTMIETTYLFNILKGMAYFPCRPRVTKEEGGVTEGERKNRPPDIYTEKALS